ncbi:MAG: nucleotidyltransferase family protein [Deltaproteobacteria bacterium]|nr:MAG: nucleotidyltransferase family protein [Deltaproteobacteria bacterium]
MHQAFVLAAGFGTRLQPLTHHRPKPLVPVCGIPMLRYTLAHAARHGLRTAVVNAHHLHDQVEAWAGAHDGVDVEVVSELPDILGTGGGLRNVRDRLAERFVVLNGDILHDVDLGALLARVPAGGAAMALRPDEADRYGVVAADATDTVVQLVSVAEADAEGPVDRSTHFTGIHAMDRAALERVPDGFACIVRTAYKQLVPARSVRSLRHEGLWLDVGDPAAYLAANRAALRGDLPLALDPFAEAAHGRTTTGEVGTPRGARIAGTAWIGAGATVRGASLTDTVVGVDAVVPEGTELRGCVVWDGVTVPAGSWTDTIFLPDGPHGIG